MNGIDKPEGRGVAAAQTAQGPTGRRPGEQLTLPFVQQSNHGMAFMQAVGHGNGGLPLVSHRLLVRLGWPAKLLFDLARRPHGAYWQAC